MTHGAPWVRIMSCNPLELKDPVLPPTFSGYPTDDRTGWEEFGAEVERTHRDTWERFNAFMVDSGAPPLPDLEFIHESEHLNLYVFPEAADYPRSRPPAPTWHRLESSVRQTEEAWDVPEELAGEGALVYLSLGSLGSADVELMRRLVAVLADTPHRYVVSKGPRADEFELPDNMWGEARVPQTNVIPHCDLVITHGGNNTTTEAFHFGKPMIVLPLFWDQYDNAQRVDELGLGVRLDTYAFEDDELRGAVDRLVGDPDLRSRAEDARGRDPVGGRDLTRRGPDRGRGAERLARLVLTSQLAPRRPSVSSSRSVVERARAGWRRGERTGSRPFEEGVSPMRSRLTVLVIGRGGVQRRVRRRRRRGRVRRDQAHDPRSERRLPRPGDQHERVLPR